MIRIALIGDIHLAFNQNDVDYFNQSNYDLLLFVGDLARYRYRETLQVAQVMARLEKTALYIPGNHDTVTALQMLGEVQDWPWLKRLASVRHRQRFRRTERALGTVQLSAYDTHPFTIRGLSFDIVTARPFAFGESSLSYARFLAQRYGVRSQAESVQKLCACVDAARSDALLFLAHTGPFGLGSGRTDIWGIDYQAGAGDNGDKDLREAIQYAKAAGKRILGVLAGHMHHSVKKGGQRTWRVEHEGTHYVNAARVPRIFKKDGRVVHHYVRLALYPDFLEVSEQFFVPNR